MLMNAQSKVEPTFRLGNAASSSAPVGNVYVPALVLPGSIVQTPVARLAAVIVTVAPVRAAGASEL